MVIISFESGREGAEVERERDGQAPEDTSRDYNSMPYVTH